MTRKEPHQCQLVDILSEVADPRKKKGLRHPSSDADLLKLRREHWTLENKLHWVRDTVFQEDASTVRTGTLPQVMAALRNTAISVLRFSGRTKSLTHYNFSPQNLNSQLTS